MDDHILSESYHIKIHQSLSDQSNRSIQNISVSFVILRVLKFIKPTNISVTGLCGAKVEGIIS
jgi:hypothetical protein